ncbi:Hsp20/alpha crystallin family protein [Bacillus songklensis]|uniref:Hsp20/alpha crystallin family protein n=1 Tax=Bacillus songklensis TaxID=1069116 RepID=A0ABV8B713_9BACI
MFPFGNFPHQKYIEQFLKQMNTNGIDEYVKNMMSSASTGSMPDFFKNHEFFKSRQDNNFSSPSSSSPPKLDAHVFETLDECIVQVKIPDKSMLHQLKVLHSPYHCIIEWVDEEPCKEEIKLPCSVRRKGTTAVYRNGILEIKMPKYPHMPVSEVDVHDHD